MKINCDMGESFGSWTMGMDEEVMPLIDMASIACGFHASDPLIMEHTVQMALAEDVVIGAHPGYPDLAGFGRRDLSLHPQELKAGLVYQLAALDGICRVNGTRVEYVKPHGALYNKMMRDEATMTIIMEAVRDFAPDCPLVVLATPGSEEISAKGREYDIEVWFEAFSDRAYDDEGRLVNRSQPGAVHQDIETIGQQVQQIINEQSVTTLSGKRIPIQADTICVHGDSQHALDSARHIRDIISSS
ncbi:5-oxoprolinase subunit PxpA [Solemya velum gill symbiont]|uniref:Lactam utilization protein B-like protein n=1 Tax=Solemya velum gill symbiont TaxID=2340 RepID=A0A0B0H764_SOVGS|nr:5-oxoprolinase subunit PxpA [Solemya velum gill symbiont]KHF24492.1 lactam utilization protein B-like protein [Solemya velum gill symbiont]OOY34972.1 hypothetical protein BOV88_07630 [Solemya velum gill symbiont]OOY36808.1 hypothetical protein BOV89_10795 [Solemya velum gill symbiont]OOY39828.1 hypothetical protein BOV90_07350 [Solemya velum gill symbiont]OOY44294.1 hypothetical protein BOV91_01800 [Solemya velum gill symbiont]